MFCRTASFVTDGSKDGCLASRAERGFSTKKMRHVARRPWIAYHTNQDREMSGFRVFETDKISIGLELLRQPSSRCQLYFRTSLFQVAVNSTDALHGLALPTVKFERCRTSISTMNVFLLAFLAALGSAAGERPQISVRHMIRLRPLVDLCPIGTNAEGMNQKRLLNG